MSKEQIPSLGEAARRARKALKLTQEKVAERLEVSVEFYARIERGTAMPGIEVFARMVSVLKVSADVLLREEATRAAAALRALHEDPPEFEELVTFLRTAPASTLRLVNSLLQEFERAEAAGKAASESAATRARRSRRGKRKR